MTLHKDQDPGWWRRGMTKRGQWIVVLGAVAVFAFVAIIIIVNGIPLV